VGGIIIQTTESGCRKRRRRPATLFGGDCAMEKETQMEDIGGIFHSIGLWKKGLQVCFDVIVI
jgi:hypothetical protein